MPYRRRDLLPLAAMLLDQFALGFFQAIEKIVEPLLALIDPLHHACKCTVLGSLGERLPRHKQAITHGARKP